MKPAAPLAFGLLLAASLAMGQQAAEKPIFDPKRDAAKDISDAVKLAKKQNKRILIDVGGNWCGWCKLLDKMFKTDADVAKILKERYIVVKVNWSEENKNEKVLANYPKVEAFPHLFVLDKSGKLLHSQDTGALETGDHHDHDKVMTFLKKWAA
ncbi:thioredoxin family protein [bacterium]|nr:MAG: thioredoxin family protein [bacterium]